MFYFFSLVFLGFLPGEDAGSDLLMVCYGRWKQIPLSRHLICANKLIVDIFFFGGVLNIFASNSLVFLGFVEVQEGLERSGRLVGTISSYFRRNPI